jgi:hypothetical protein
MKKSLCLQFLPLAFALLLLLSLSSCPTPGGGGPAVGDTRTLTVTGMTYPWAGTMNSFSVDNVAGLDPKFTVPGGQGVHKVTLTYVTTSANAPSFTIQADSEASQAITANGTPASYHSNYVTLTQIPAGTYTLTIELPTSGATFTSSEDWTLGITGLSTTSAANTVTVSSSDTAGAALAIDPVCFPYAESITNATTAVAAVKIPGGLNIDEVVMYIKIESSGTPSLSSRILPVIGTSTTTYSLVDDGSTWPSDGTLYNGSGYNFTLTKLTGITNTWMLEIRNDRPNSISKPPAFSSDLTSILLVQGLSSTDTATIFCASRNDNKLNYSGTEPLDLGLVILDQPPRPVIYVGGNGTVGGLNLSMNPQDIEGTGLTYAWTISDGVTPLEFSTQQNPGTNPFSLNNYSSNGNYTITCTITEMLVTGLSGSIANISQTGSCQAGVTISN